MTSRYESRDNSRRGGTCVIDDFFVARSMRDVKSQLYRSNLRKFRHKCGTVVQNNHKHAECLEMKIERERETQLVFSRYALSFSFFLLYFVLTSRRTSPHYFVLENARISLAPERLAS